MTSRQRLRRVLARGVPDRVPVVDTGFWTPTLERWHAEGLPEGQGPAEYFGLDTISCFGFDASLQLPTRVLEETDQWVVATDSDGATVKSWKRHYATPARLGWSICTDAHWQAHKPRLTVDRARIGEDLRERYRHAEEAGHYRAISPIEPGWFALEHAVGFERTLTAMVEDQPFIHDVFSAYTQFTLGMCELVMSEGMSFDAMWVFSDLCYKNGMLFSPRAYRETLQPYHRQMADFCHARGMPFILHCDGDVREFVPLLIEAGFDCIQPLEARCGNDVRALKPLYGARIVLFGNIGAEAMAAGGERLEEEVRTKVLAAKVGGGYIYHSDHSVPPTVSFDNYARTIELVRECGAYS